MEKLSKIEWATKCVTMSFDESEQVLLIVELLIQRFQTDADLYAIINNTLEFKYFGGLVERLGGIDTNNADLQEIHRLASCGYNDISMAEDALQGIADLVDGLRHRKVNHHLT